MCSRLFASVCFVGLLVAHCAGADLSVHPLFSKGAVLQRDQPVRIWGEASPSRKVSISFRDQNVSVSSGEDGSWSAVLAPESAGGPHSLRIESDGETVTIEDIYVGEVWFASGQSNMQFRVRYLNAERAPAISEPDRGFRILKLRQRAADSPLSVTHVNDRWSVVDETTIREFSAVGYFFGRELRERLGVPVGIIASAVGGTSIGNWLSAEGLATLPAARERIAANWEQSVARFPEVLKKYEEEKADWEAGKAAAEAAGRPFARQAPRAPVSPRRPACLFNGMVSPVIPYSIRGILWYQGESDAGSLGDLYGSLQIALMHDWRSRWGKPEMPFFFVQLPGFSEGKNWADFRGQQAAALSEPGSGMIVAIDLGEKDNVHPKDKRPVGRRLANLALRNVYGIPAPAEGPRPSSVVRDGAKVRVAFACEPGARVVFKTSTKACGFELREAGGTFVPAEAMIEGNVLVLASPGVSVPNEIRYAWENWPDLSVFDSSQLPAAPFVATVKPLP